MALKVITPSSNTGYDPVGSTDYRSGMVAARNASGEAVVCGSSADPNPATKPIGVFGEDRLTTALQATSQVEEEVTVNIAVNVALSHDSVVPGSYRLVRKSDSTLLVEGAGQDYTITPTTGVIDFLSGGPASLADGQVIVVTYSFYLNDAYEKNFRGVGYSGSLDDTAGSNKATVWKGHGEFETDQFVTSRSYAVGDLLRVTRSGHGMGAGLLTNEASGTNVGATVAARVTKVPTASDPFLGFEWIPVAA